MPDDLLITAPFIREVPFEGSIRLQRIDPAGRQPVLVTATPLVRRVLAQFARPCSRAQAVAQHAAEDRPYAAMAIAQLREREFLLPVAAVRLKAPSLELEITNRCNAACVMCPRADLRPLGLMPEETFARVIRLLERCPLPGVALQGIGEPTLHPRLVEWTGALRRALGPGIPIVLVTNGFQMTPALMERLVAAGVSLVQWSFHSLDAATYNGIMGAPRFERVQANLVACAARYGHLISAAAPFPPAGSI